MNKLLYLYRHNNPTLNDAFERIAVGIHLKKQKEGLKSVLLCGCEPAVGTTSVAINLGISMSLSGWKTVLVDADLRKIAQYKRLNDETAIGVSEYLSMNVPFEQIVSQTNYNLLHYIPCGMTSKSSVSLFCSDRMDQLMEQLNQNYDYVIFDIPAANAAVDANVLATKTDGVILVAAQGVTSKKQIRETKKEMENASAKVLGIIVNRVEKSEYKRNLENYDYFKKKKYIGGVKKIKEEDSLIDRLKKKFPVK